MTELQSLVERLEKAVGRLEMVSHGPGAHGGYGEGPQNGKRHPGSPVLSVFQRNFTKLGTLAVGMQLPVAGVSPLPPPLGSQLLAFLKEAPVLK